MTNLIGDGKADDLTIPNAKLDAGISIIQPITPLEPLLETSAAQSEEAEERDQEVPHIFIAPDTIPEPHRSTEDLLQRTLRNIETCIELSKKQLRDGVRFTIAPDEDKFPLRIIPSSILPDGNFFLTSLSESKFFQEPVLAKREIEENVAEKRPRKEEEEELLGKKLIVQKTDFTATVCDTKTRTTVPQHLNFTPTHSAKQTLLGASPEEMATQMELPLNNISLREMAIDVPEAFVGSIKRPPRYPGASAGDSDAAAVQEAERIKRYQAELRKRNEEEQNRAKKDELLRSSLRGSKKLQALERNAKPLPPPGISNLAFEEELQSSEEPSGVSINGSFESTEVPDAQSMKQALEKISAVLRRENGEFAEDLAFIEQLFSTPEFQRAADLHSLIESRPLGSTPPVTTPVETAGDLMDTVRRLLPTCTTRDAQELQAVLSTPQFENLLVVHDKLAAHQDELRHLQATSSDTSDYGGIPNESPPGFMDADTSFHSDAPTVRVEENGHAIQPIPLDISPTQSNYVGADMRIVKIEKHGDLPLGATIKIDPHTRGVMIARIVHGGVAQKSGLLHENDELLDVNGYDLRNKELDEVCEILSKLSGTLTFVIVPAQPSLIEPPKHDYTVSHWKAHFDFYPDDNTYPEEVRCPCAALGLAFRKGDILHVRNDEDHNWWQAYRDGDEVGSRLAGLIPSKEFQQQREDFRIKKMTDGTYMNGMRKKGKHFGKKSKSKKRKKVVPGSPLDVDLGEVPWYEEVSYYYPKPHIKRPIILIGPHHVGRQELRERLMATDIDRFAPVIPHTTRPRREGENHAFNYYFISRHQFEDDITRGRFVEHGEFEKHLYGTSFDAIKDVVTKGKICVLNLQPQSLRLLRASDLKPFVVFIAPPSLDKLRQNRLKMGFSAKDDELKQIIEDAREMEESYGHYFDLVIVNKDFDKAFEELLDQINRLEREGQWVPVSWLQ